MSRLSDADARALHAGLPSYNGDKLPALGGSTLGLRAQGGVSSDWPGRWRPHRPEFS
jgi:hypothetical protein